MHRNQWTEAASALGLTLTSAGAYRPGRHLRWLARDLDAARVPVGFDAWPWMVGRWRDHHVVLLPSDLAGDTPTACFLADISPAFPFPCWTTNDHYPYVEGAVDVLVPAVANALQTLPILRPWVAVSSSAVELRVALDGLDVAVMRQRLDDVVTVASAVRAAIPPRQRPAIVERFTALARARGLTDDGAGHVTGVVAAMPTDLDFQAEPRASFVAIEARFPHSLELGLNLFQQERGVASFLERLVDVQDIRVDHPAFDDAVVVQGRDRKAVRTRLADVTLTGALAALAHGADTFRMTDGGLVARHCVDVDDVALPDRFVDAVATVGAMLFPSEGSGPYR